MSLFAIAPDMNDVGENEYPMGMLVVEEELMEELQQLEEKKAGAD